MAKLKGPLLSLDAFGHIGKTFAVSHWKGIKKAIKHFTPQNPRTVLQQDNRSIMRYAVWSWQSLDNDQKWSYDQSAKNLSLKMSGYNYYLQIYIAAHKYILTGPILYGLIAWWKLDENQGSIAYDLISGHNATLYNASWVDGHKNFGIYLNGTNAYLKVPHHADLNPGTGGWTVEIWIKPDPDINIPTLLVKHVSDIDYWIISGTYKINQTVYAHLHGSGGPEHIEWPNQPVDIANGNWHQIVITRDENGGDYLKHFIDVDSSYSVSRITDNNVVPVGDLYLGSYKGTAGFFKGAIDEIRIYNRPLTQDEIRHNYEI